MYDVTHKQILHHDVFTSLLTVIRLRDVQLFNSSLRDCDTDSTALQSLVSAY